MVQPPCKRLKKTQIVALQRVTTAQQKHMNRLRNRLAISFVLAIKKCTRKVHIVQAIAPRHSLWPYLILPMLISRQTFNIQTGRVAMVTKKLSTKYENKTLLEN